MQTPTLYKQASINYVERAQRDNVRSESEAHDLLMQRTAIMQSWVDDLNNEDPTINLSFPINWDVI